VTSRKDVHVGLILALTIRGLAVTSYDEMRRVAALAEEVGFDSVWLCDHFLTLAPDAYATDAGMARGDAGARTATAAARSMPLLECWTSLSALARDTRRVRLGTSVLCHSYRLPSVLAKMGATLDVISGGRLDLGLGAGWFAEEYRAYGIPFPPIGERIAQLEEGAEIIRRMWTESRPVFAGRHYAIDGAVCDPPPLQRPHPPIWIGGEGDRVHRVAARTADGVNVRWWGPERIAARGAYLDDACRAAGRDPAALQRSVTALLVVDRDAARAAATRERFTAIPADGHVAGTSAQCVARLREYVAAGVRHVLLTIPDVTSSAGLELAGREILPALRHEAARG
jgi:probable F420-dependent oxidoreductase